MKKIILFLCIFIIFTLQVRASDDVFNLYQKYDEHPEKVGDTTYFIRDGFVFLVGGCFNLTSFDCTSWNYPGPKTFSPDLWADKFYHANSEEIPGWKDRYKLNNQERVTGIYSIYARQVPSYEKVATFPPGSGYYGNDVLKEVLPIYIPNKKYPIGFYFVWTDSQKTENEDGYYSAKVYSNGRAKWFPWFRGGKLARWPHYYQKDSIGYIWKNRTGDVMPKNTSYADGLKNMQAYLKSQESDWQQAHQLQIYWYLNAPLLVARNETGEVYKVFFQGRDIPNPMQRAKMYLGDEWYAPMK